MRRIIRSIVLCAVLFSGFSMGLAAQEMTAEEKKAEKEFYESVEREIERLTNSLKLEDWQVFMVDSILQHDNYAMLVEINNLSKAKVGNTDIYVQCRDKWDEQMYTAFRKVFNDAQWEKYLKNGAGREKKNRDKRAEKREKNK